jgi:hypothetical protein
MNNNALKLYDMYFVHVFSQRTKVALNPKMYSRTSWPPIYPWTITLGCKFFKVYQNLVTTSPFLSFLPSHFLPCKDTFMDDYDGI